MFTHVSQQVLRGGCANVFLMSVLILNSYLSVMQLQLLDFVRVFLEHPALPLQDCKFCRPFLIPSVLLICF